MTRLRILLTIALFSCLGPFTPSATGGESPAANPVDSALLDRLVDTLRDMKFFGPQTIPTAPRPVARMVPEWHPAEAVLVSVHSLPAILGSGPGYAQLAGLVGRILPMVDVLILYPEREETLVGELIDRLEKEPGIRNHTTRLSFYPLPGPSMWIRDNGPIFGWTDEGELAAFDFSARPFMDEEEAWSTIPSELAGLEWMQEEAAFKANRRRERLADATPTALKRHLSLRTGRELPMARPPISLQGGDYIVDGNGNIFISQETLFANGGDEATLRAAFRKYVGPFDLHFLFPLPGNTPKHLDMVLKFIDEKTAFIAAPPELPEAPLSPYLRRLSFEIEKALAYNREYLGRHFPGITLIELPLLPLVDEPPARMLNRLRWRIIARVCELNGLDVIQLMNGDDEKPRRREINDAVLDALERDLGRPIKLETVEELQAAALHYLRLDLNTVIETNVPFLTIYRSPVNSSHLVDTDGREKFILPRFKSREGEDPAQIEGLHNLIEARVREARPKAVIEWVEADVAVDLQGGLHCMTVSLPAQPALAK